MKKILKAITLLSLTIGIMLNTNVVFAAETGKIWFEEKQNILYKKAYIPHADLERAAKSDAISKAIAVKIFTSIAGAVVYPAVGIQGLVKTGINTVISQVSKKAFKTLNQEWLALSKKKGDTGVRVTFMWSDPQDIALHLQCTKLSLTHPWMECRGKGWKYLEVE